MVELINPYCTLLDVQRETKNSGSELDDHYVTCINMASRWVDDFCHRDFFFHDHTTEPFLVARKDVLLDEVYLPFPVLRLDSFAVDGDQKELEYFSVHTEGGIITFDGGDVFDYPYRGRLELFGEFGYASADNKTPSPNLPSSIVRATVLVASAFSNEKRVEQIGFDGQRVELIDNRITKDVKMKLKRFVRRANHSL